ncbi:MAG: hypothetical protein IKS23_05475 [Alphaproteobacteria bacterium]|nr:hypothetical protein [Alphaproteobacteria bacterium]
MKNTIKIAGFIALMLLPCVISYALENGGTFSEIIILSSVACASFAYGRFARSRVIGKPVDMDKMALILIGAFIICLIYGGLTDFIFPNLSGAFIVLLISLIGWAIPSKKEAEKN